MQRVLVQMLATPPPWPILLGWVSIGVLGVNYLYSKNPSDGWDLPTQLAHPALAPLRKALATLALSDTDREALLHDVRTAINRYGWTESATKHLPYLSSAAANGLVKSRPSPYCEVASDSVILPFVAASNPPLVSSPYRWAEPLQLQKRTSRGVESTLTGSDIVLLLAHFLLSYEICVLPSGEDLKEDWELLFQIDQGRVVAYRQNPTKSL